MTAVSSNPDRPRASPWSPLRIPLYRALWIAAIASNIGTWMHEVGAGWLMTTLSPTPVMVALVQTATSFPALLLALPAGALADIIDRRRYLLMTQTWLACVAALLGFLTLTGMTTAWALVGLTFAIGIGTAMNLPAWAAVTPEIVPRSELPAAIALNSVGMNLARAIGPALAGFIVALAGTGTVFMLNAVSFLGVMVFLHRWKRQPAASMLPAERFFSALRTGFRFVRHHRPLHGAMIRGAAFFLFASAPWALLPLIARFQVGGGPQTLGLLVAAIGAGAVIGAVILPRLRARYSRDVLVAGATALYAAAMVGVALLTDTLALAMAMLLSGAAWIAALSSLQVAAQLALPDWVRSRGLAVFMATFMGSMAFGSLLWGSIAQHTTLQAALLVAAAGALFSARLTWRWKISGIEDLDLSPSMHWPAPVAHDTVTHDRGPVMVTIAYRVHPARRDEFLALIRDIGKGRRRDGAFSWGIVEDSGQPHRFLEYFMVESWLEHLRQHSRVTNADRILQDRVRRLLADGSEPEIAHYIAPDDYPA